ncbi:uncharacterized protein LOC110862894 isoform X2 [Folsomia candida]|uniref:uncharacterized protein LOC110862894 isoform X2 n=1 Tax=Folsomia candida TaxID=158441 RepID=UPI00160514C7|nr:uncharacterized protein LOC110862894 isoform X2 [Folsomia candida]
MQDYTIVPGPIKIFVAQVPEIQPTGAILGTVTVDGMQEGSDKLVPGPHDAYLETASSPGRLNFFSTSLFNTFIATERTDWLERKMNITFTNGTVKTFVFSFGITDENNHKPTFIRDNSFPYKQTIDGQFLEIQTGISVTDGDIDDNCVQDVTISSSLPIGLYTSPIWGVGFMGFQLTLRTNRTKQELYNHKIQLTAFDSTRSTTITVTLQPY